MTLSIPSFALAARDMVDRAARHSPARLAVTIFVAVILAFTSLLMLPVATASGQGASLADALFTATSAVCVTGLTVVETAVFWSPFGQVVILVAIKVGGLGVLTLASLLGLAVSRRIGLTQRLLAASETKAMRLGEVGALLRIVIITSTAVEMSIAVVITGRFLSLGKGFGESVWDGIFYGVSTFNNAGFVPTKEGLQPYVGDWWICLPIIIGTFIGSLGFPVIMTVSRSWRRGLHWRKWRYWNLHTKLVLASSAILAVLGMFFMGIFEWTNPDTFGDLPLPDKILATMFAGTMPRSTGFSTVDVGLMHRGTWLLSDALMFVGGGPASTAGGIKVTTLAVMLLAIRAEARGDRDIEAFGRRIPPASLRLAVAASLVGATLVLVSTLTLLAMTDWPLDQVLFEVISAFATCGLSTGVTPQLEDPAKYMLSMLMLMGRTGTMTLAAALALRDRRRVIRYPEERPIIG